MSIITGRGDSGETDLLYGKRIAKSSLRVGVLGCIDELNAALGLARVASTDAEITGILDGLQEKLVGLMGELACVPADAERYTLQFKCPLTMEDVLNIQETAREAEKRGIRFTGWARPGAEGSMMKAGLDFARTIARRTEREVWLLHESGEPVSEAIRLFFNRVSDLLWILARVSREESGT